MVRCKSEQQYSAVTYEIGGWPSFDYKNMCTALHAHSSVLIATIPLVIEPFLAERGVLPVGGGTLRTSVGRRAWWHVSGVHRDISVLRQ